jgi:hypothetical protein
MNSCEADTYIESEQSFKTLSKLSWSSQSIKLKVGGISEPEIHTESMVAYLEKFKTELDLYAMEVASVYPATLST